MLVFYVESYQTLSVDLYILAKKKGIKTFVVNVCTIKKFHNFGQNHGVTTLEKCQFFDYFKSMFL